MTIQKAKTPIEFMNKKTEDSLNRKSKFGECGKIKGKCGTDNENTIKICYELQQLTSSNAPALVNHAAIC